MYFIRFNNSVHFKHLTLHRFIFSIGGISIAGVPKFPENCIMNDQKKVFVEFLIRTVDKMNTV